VDAIDREDPIERIQLARRLRALLIDPVIEVAAHMKAGAARLLLALLVA